MENRHESERMRQGESPQGGVHKKLSNVERAIDIIMVAHKEQPYTNDGKFGKTPSKREKMLAEAFELITSMSDRQLYMFIDLIRREPK